MRRLVLLLATAAVALTACSGGSSDSRGSAAPTVSGARAATLIAASVDEAAEQQNARMSGRVTVAMDGETKTLPVYGALDFRSGAFELGYDLSQLGVPGTDAKVRTRMVDGVMYVSFGDVAGEVGRVLSSLLRGKEWVKLDLASLGLGRNSTAAGGLAQADPGGLLKLLRDVGEVQTVGPESVRDVPTTHYRGVIDRGVGDSLDVPVDIWVDADGRTRKLSASLDTAGMKVESVFEYYDFGAELDVNEPFPEQVLDFADIFGDWRPPPGPAV